MNLICAATLPASIASAPRMRVVEDFVEMWKRLSLILGVFNCEWEDFATWVEFDGSESSVPLRGTDFVDAKAMFERRTKAGVTDVTVVNCSADPAWKLSVRIDSRIGRSSGVLIRPGGSGAFEDHEPPSDLIRQDQMSDITKVLVDVWRPISCAWINPQHNTSQKPSLKFGPNPWRSRMEWTTSLGWCTYLDTAVVPVSASVEWPEGVVAEKYSSGIMIRIGDSPSDVNLAQITAVRKALGWPHVSSDGLGQRI
ncbi:hypothetical protein [Nocardia coubleae]|uniref:Immunity protein 52 domain-containing protein n=1 Tax=Nocardia coubleae TaxID=356147 RepID=A0A846W4K9_9NOCA|nr:hypothetical protein [Nocardia coubleae]NKX87488.1 hypothetical protein [Nocardia coubleae]